MIGGQWMEVRLCFAVLFPPASVHDRGDNANWRRRSDEWQLSETADAAGMHRYRADDCVAR